MAQITLGGTPCQTVGELPAVGSAAPSFTLTRDDMSSVGLNDLAGKRVILNIFPSVDTGICATSSRKFNAEASSLDNTVVACVSKDLPFAMKRFCGAEGLDDIVMLSDYKTGEFGKNYGVTIANGAFEELFSRAIVVLNESGEVIYTQQVFEVGTEPDYESALAALT